MSSLVLSGEWVLLLGSRVMVLLHAVCATWILQERRVCICGLHRHSHKRVGARTCGSRSWICCSCVACLRESSTHSKLPLHVQQRPIVVPPQAWPEPPRARICLLINAFHCCGRFRFPTTDSCQCHIYYPLSSIQQVYAACSKQTWVPMPNTQPCVVSTSD